MSSQRPINMRVTANSSQGHRKYMEDCYKIRFQRDTPTTAAVANTTTGELDPNNNNQQSDILFSYFGIFDGHGGAQASQYCKQHLYWSIIRQEGFWSRDDDSAVLDAIRKGFVQCHDDMWSQLPSWPRTASGLPSTSGTTATVVFIKGSRVYVGHVGDSGLAVGMKSRRTSSDVWEGRKMTRDHKPEDPIELKRILGVGGDVQLKSGVNRVVWNRPVFNRFQSRNFKSQSGLSSMANTNGSSDSSNSSNNSNSNNNKTKSKLNNHNPSTPYELNYLRNEPNTPTERIPFLAVARSLGDLWSYSSTHNDYVVSPVPDTFYFDLDPTHHKCLILATDGLWNVISVNECIEIVRRTDRETEEMMRRGGNNTSSSNNKRRKSEGGGGGVQPFVNPSQRLVQTAINRCYEKMVRADNTTCITIMLDSPAGYVDEPCERSSRPPTFTLGPSGVSHRADKTLENYSRIEGSGENEAAMALMNLTDRDDVDDGDDFDDEEDEYEVEEFDDDVELYERPEGEEDEEEEAVTNRSSRARRRRRRGRTTTTKPISSTRLVEAHSEPELATPIKPIGDVGSDTGGGDKRSRSLTSLRRRHWSSASSSVAVRSPSVNHLAAPPPPPPPPPHHHNHHHHHRFNNEINASRRSRHQHMPAPTSSHSNTFYKLDGEKRVGSYIKSNNTNASSLKNNPNLMNHIRNGGGDAAQKLASSRKQHHQHRSNVNLSQSVCSFVSAGGKHLRKSMNDIFASTANKLATAAVVEEETTKTTTTAAVVRATTVGKEHQEEATKENKNKLGYAKRLKRTLIKTKNSLFNRKPATTTAQNNTAQNTTITTTTATANHHALKRKSTSSPSLAKLNLTTGAATRFDLELDANQSFVNSFRSRFIKRSRSSKLANPSSFIQNNLNSTSITTKLSSTVLAGPASSSSSSISAPKRPKFY